MYLHEDKKQFFDVIEETHKTTSLESAVIEKDYYVTMILKSVSEKSKGLGEIVFKGGTSLSKCHKVIDRFSEDIDITFTEHIGEQRRKHLKYDVMKITAEELNLPIKNWDFIQSDRDLNSYYYDYKTLFTNLNVNLREGVKVETALASYSFPTETMQISSYVGDYLNQTRTDLVEKFSLTPFMMKVQSLERTFIDKVYASCDYYLQNKNRRLSRHIYDLYKIYPKIAFDEKFEKLVEEVKTHRSTLSICPSTKPGINVSELIQKFCIEDFYKPDFDIITETLINEEVEYSAVINTILKIAEFDFWQVIVHFDFVESQLIA